MTAANLTFNRFTTQTVERLSIRVVVDYRYDRFMPKVEHDSVQVEHLASTTP